MWEREREESSTADAAWDEYRSVIRDWNDSINRNLALIQQYFGTVMRNSFDYEIGYRLVRIGKQLEDCRTNRAPLSQGGLRDLGHGLDEVALLIYQFNLR